jgi:hypothetical protein
MRQFVFCIPLVALFAVSAAGQDAVAIKIAYPQAGQRAKVTVEEKTASKTVFTVGGKAQAKEEAKTKSLVYVDEVIENPKNAKRATKLKRTFEKAAVGTGGKDAALPVEGKTVLIEKSGDKYAFTVDGKAVDAESLKLLEDEFDRPEGKDPRDVMFPNKPVKPGETWKIDIDELVKAIGDKGPTFGKDKATATGTLVKAYMKDGKQFGVIDFVFEAPITGFGEKNPLTIKEGKMTLKFAGDGCIDGTVATGKSTAKMLMALAGSTMGVEIKVEIEDIETRTMEMLPKK